MVHGDVIVQCKWTIRAMLIAQLHLHGPSFMDHLTFTFEAIPTHVELQPNLEGMLLRLLRPLAEGDFELTYAAASDPLIWEQHPESCLKAQVRSAGHSGARRNSIRKSAKPRKTRLDYR